MAVHDLTTCDLIAGLLNRLDQDVYEAHKVELDLLAQRISAEQLDADVRAGRYAHG